MHVFQNQQCVVQKCIHAGRCVGNCQRVFDICNVGGAVFPQQIPFLVGSLHGNHVLWKLNRAQKWHLIFAGKLLKDFVDGLYKQVCCEPVRICNGGRAEFRPVVERSPEPFEFPCDVVFLGFVQAEFPESRNVSQICVGEVL